MKASKLYHYLNKNCNDGLYKEFQPINFIDLGRLKSIDGTQVYSINNNVNVQDFKYTLVHCQQFNHLFGSANIQ